MGRTLKHGKTVEGSWGSGLAPVTMFAPWDMQPRSPFRLQRWPENDREIVRGDFIICTEFDDAINEFMMWDRQRGMTALMIDESFRCVLGWSGTESVWCNMQTPFWYGVEATFRRMEMLGYDPWFVLGIEFQAMGTAQ